MIEKELEKTMKDKWSELNEWEDKHKIAVFMTISVDDIRDYFETYFDEEQVPQSTKNLTDEELWEAIQHVSSKYDFGDAYGDIYDWVVEKAQEWKDTKMPKIYESPDGGITVRARDFLDYENTVTINRKDIENA